MWGLGILNGLRISMRNMLRGPMTIRYPHERAELPERARWAVRPKYFEDGSIKCTACLTCVRVCPDHILSLDITTGEDKSKHIDRFGYEIGACMMCGLCVEACPFDAIRMSHEYELAVIDPTRLIESLIMDLDAATGARHRAEKEAVAARAAGAAAESEEGSADE